MSVLEGWHFHYEAWLAPPCTQQGGLHMSVPWCGHVCTCDTVWPCNCVNVWHCDCGYMWPWHCEYMWLCSCVCPLVQCCVVVCFNIFDYEMWPCQCDHLYVWEYDCIHLWHWWYNRTMVYCKYDYVRDWDCFDVWHYQCHRLTVYMWESGNVKLCDSVHVWLWTLNTCTNVAVYNVPLPVWPGDSWLSDGITSLPELTADLRTLKLYSPVSPNSRALYIQTLEPCIS